jgi:hypothetical protein
MSPLELWWLVEAKRQPSMVGSLTEEETAELYEMIYGTS